MSISAAKIESRQLQNLRLISLGLVGLTALASAFVLAGNFLGFADDLPKMKPQTAACVLMLSVSFYLGFKRSSESPFLGLRNSELGKKLLSTALAVVPIFFGIATLINQLLSLNFQVEMDVFRSVFKFDVALPSAITFVVLGGCLLHRAQGESAGEVGADLDRNTAQRLAQANLRSRYRYRVRGRLCEAAALFVVFLNFCGCMGFLFGIYRFNNYFPGAAMPFSSSLTLLLLSVAILISFHQGRFVNALMSRRIGGMLFRKIFPEIVFFPFLIGALKFTGERFGMFHPDAGLALAMVASFLIWFRVAFRSSSLLDRVDAIREKFDTKSRKLVASFEEKVRQRTLQIQDSEAFLKSLLESIPSMIFVKNYPALEFVQVNKAAEELLGFPRSELLGKTDYDFFPEKQADFFVASDRSVMESGKTLEVQEEEIKTKDKGVRVLHTIKVPVYDRDHKPQFLLGISVDITELKKAHRVIQNQQASMVAAARLAEIGNMAGGIAHEINNPLGVIQLEAGLLRVGSEEGQLDLAQVRKSVEKIENTTARIAKIVMGLRVFSGDTLSAGEEFKDASIMGILDLALGLCRQKIQNYGIELRTPKVSADLQLECLQVELSQAFFNIIHNAVEALATVDRKWLQLEVVGHPDRVEVLIADGGSGVLPENRDKIFIPFFTTKPIGKGTGLGLSIAKGIIEKHHGTIRLMPTTRYTCFEVILPRKQGLHLGVKQEMAS